LVSQNEHTGARLVSKTLSKEGQENWDLIFGKRIKEQKLTQEDLIMNMDQVSQEVTSSRIDIIGQNGNEGDHYSRSQES
jgi:hypothetical protein